MLFKPVCIIGGKGSGKTTELIKLAEKHFAYLVVRDRKTAYWVAEKAKQEGKDIPFPLTYDEFIRGRFYRGGIRCFIIDDAGTLLSYMARGVELKAFSIDSSTIVIVEK